MSLLESLSVKGYKLSFTAGIVIPIAELVFPLRIESTLFALISPLLPSVSISFYNVIGTFYALQFLLALVLHTCGAGTDEQYFRSMAVIKVHNFLYFGPYLALRLFKPPWTILNIILKIMFGAECLFVAMVWINGSRLDYHNDFDRSLTRTVFKVYEYIFFPLSRIIAQRLRLEQLSHTPPTFTFKYPKLEEARDFRLLRINPGLPFRQPSCDILHYTLDDAPPFETLSYTWGKRDPSIPISVGGSGMLVTGAVYDFIIHHRSTVFSVHVWIDAICIDQNNTSEKNVQLLLMIDIYRRSLRVIVWLSPPEELNVARQTRLLLFALGDNVSPGGRTRFEFLQNLFPIVREEEPAHRGLAQLLIHPWFERVWVVQEVAVGTRVHVMHNGICVEWDTVVQAVRALRANRDVFAMFLHYLSDVLPDTELEAGRLRLHRHISNIIYMDSVQASTQLKHPGSLREYISGTREFQATNPRDRVFALIRISSDSNRLPFDLDYTDEVEEVFIKTSLFLLSTPSWFQTLTLTGRGYTLALNYGTCSPRQRALPSWAIDFEASTVFGARAGSPQLWKRSDSDGAVTATANPREILIEVVEYDTIKKVTKLGHPISLSENILLVEGKEGPKSVWIKDHVSTVRTWYMNAKELALKHAASHGMSEEEATKALWETFMVECDLSNDIFTSMTRLCPFDFRSTSARRLFEYFICSDDAESEVAHGNPSDSGMVEEIPIRDAEEIFDSIWDRMRLGVTGRAFCVTDGGRMGSVPPLSEPGDVIAHVRGGFVPAVLRCTQTGLRRGEWVGTCYVYGVEDVYSGQDWAEFLLV